MTTPRTDLADSTRSALPDEWAPNPPPSAAVYLFLGGLAASMFAGQTDQLGLPVAPQRLLLLLSLIAFGIELWDRRVFPFRLYRVHVLMILTLVWTICSAIAAGTLTTSLGFFALLDRMFLPFLFFVVGPCIFNTRERRDLLLKCLILIGVYLGATAFFEMIGPRDLIFPAYINDPLVGIHYGRARGPFVAAEADGMVMAISAFAGWIGALQFKGIWRVASVVACLACSLGCLLTLTRSIWLGFALALVVAGSSHPRTRRALPVVAGVLVAGVIVAWLVIPGLSQTLTERALTSRSLDDRRTTNAAAVRIIEQEPITGVGWLGFIDASDDYVRQEKDIPLTNTHIEVHNVILGRAAELGIPGALLWLACVLLGPLAAVRIGRLQQSDGREWRLILVAALCVWVVTLLSSPVPYPLPNLLVWLIAGLVWQNRKESFRPLGQDDHDSLSA